MIQIRPAGFFKLKDREDPENFEIHGFESEHFKVISDLDGGQYATVRKSLEYERVPKPCPQST